MTHILSLSSSLSLSRANKQFNYFLHVSLIKIYFYIINICNRVIDHLESISQSISPLNHVIQEMFFFCVSAPTVLPLNVSFFLISPSALFWIIALLLVETSVTFDRATVYQCLYTMFSWFCSFHSASVPGGHSSSHGVSPIYCSFEHNSIPSTVADFF